MFDEFEKLHKILEEREKAREELISLSRELRINSTKAISATHSEESEKARNFIEKAEKTIGRITEYKNTLSSTFR
jgi:translin